MKIHTPKKALVSALEQLTRIIPTRSTNPALTALRVRIVPAGLELSGTNLEIDLRVLVDADLPMGAEGEFGVPGHLWAQAAKKAAGALVELELKGSVLHMNSGGNTAKIQTVEEMPTLMAFPAHDAGLPLDARDLATGLRSVVYAAENNAFQAVFKGVLLHLNPQQTRMVGADGYRIAIRDSAPVAGLTQPYKLLVPRRNAEEIALRLDTDKACHLHVGEGEITITRPDLAIKVKLMYGEYPDFERVIPKALSLSARVSGAALAEALDRVSLFVDQNSNNRANLTFRDGRITVAGAGDYGDSTDVVDAVLSGSEPALDVAVNTRYVLDALKQMGGGDVVIDLANSTAPIKFTCSADAGQLAVVVALKP